MKVLRAFLTGGLFVLGLSRPVFAYVASVVVARSMRGGRNHFFFYLFYGCVVAGTSA